MNFNFYLKNKPPEVKFGTLAIRKLSKQMATYLQFLYKKTQRFPTFLADNNKSKKPNISTVSYV